VLAPHLVLREISSSSNHLIKQIRLLHERSGREKSKLFLIEGVKLLNEALAQRVDIVDIAASESFIGGGMRDLDQRQIKIVHAVNDKLFDSLSTTTTPTQVVAIARMNQASIDDCLRGEMPLTIVLDALQDPGNLGTVMRCARAFGASGLILAKGTVDPYNPKVIRAAMGASFALPIAHDASIPEVLNWARQKSMQTVALHPHADISINDFDFAKPTALFFGNEGHGLSPQILGNVDHKIVIPMVAETESLNVAISAAITLFACARVRNLRSNRQ
jgi:TrmH family RNA methyltransferase